MDASKNSQLSAEVAPALIPSDMRIVAVAKRFGWKPNMVITRIENALPAVMERQLYLEVAKDYGMQPESFAVLIREYLGSKELALQDFAERGVAKELIGFLLQTLDILTEDKRQWDIRISAKMAAKLVVQFGEGTVAMIDGIYANLDEIAERMRWVNMTHRKVMRLAILHVLRMAEAGSHRGGWDIMSYFDSGFGYPEPKGGNQWT